MLAIFYESFQLIFILHVARWWFLFFYGIVAEFSTQEVEQNAKNLSSRAWQTNSVIGLGDLANEVF